MLLAGGAGNDRLIANGAGHTLVGGLGDDTYVVFNASVTLSEDQLNEVRSSTPSVGGIDTVEAWVNVNLSTAMPRSRTSHCSIPRLPQPAMRATIR